MMRVLRTGPFPEPLGVTADGAKVVTPHRAAASALGLPYYSLPKLARDVLRTKRGVTVAPEIFARHTLKRVIAKNFPGADPASIASRIREILQTVLRVGIDIGQLIECGSPRVRELGIVTRAYKAELGDNGYIDQEALLLEASQCEPDPRKLYIYGHHRARKEEIFFINAVAGEGSVYYLPCHVDGIFTGNREWADKLATHGWQIDSETSNSAGTVGEMLAARFTGSTDAIPETAAHSYPNVEAEVRGVLSRAKSMVAGGIDPYEIAFVCRDQDTYAPVIAAVSAEYGLPVQIMHKVRLTDTVFGGFVRLLLEAAESEFSYEAAARLLLHPFGPEMPEDAWTRARLQHASGREEWVEIGVHLASIDWPERQTLVAWTASLRSVFAAFGVRAKAAARAREILAFDKFLESLAAVEKFEGGRELRFEEFSAIVGEALGDESVPFAPAAGGITLYEPNTILGAAVDHLFVMGMAEGVFPKQPSDNPVIDFFERKLLGKYGIEFEEAAEVARWEALSFYFTLLAGHRSVAFSYPSTVDSGERMPNAFFDRLGIKPVSSSTLPTSVSSVGENRTMLLRADKRVDDAVMLAARTHFAVELRREISPNYDEFDGVIGTAIDPGRRRWSASQLTAIGQCGFRWFAERVLRVKSVDEVELGLDYTKRGTFYHRVLEIAVAKAKDDADIRGATLRHLDAAFAEAEADPEVALPTLVNWDMQRPEHITALRKAVEAADFITDGSRVVGLEQKFEDTWEGFPLVGYIDRVDDTPDGLIAIDYKTSSVPPKGAKDEDGKLTVDVQIPLYSNVALKKLYPEGKLGNSVYYSLVKGKVLRKEKPDDLARLEALAGRIKEMLAAGNFAVDPDADEGACTYCQFAQLCRKGPRLAHKSTNK